MKKITFSVLVFYSLVNAICCFAQKEIDNISIVSESEKCAVIIIESHELIQYIKEAHENKIVLRFPNFYYKFGASISKVIGDKKIIKEIDWHNHNDRSVWVVVRLLKKQYHKIISKPNKIEIILSDDPIKENTNFSPVVTESDESFSEKSNKAVNLPYSENIDLPIFKQFPNIPDDILSKMKSWNPNCPISTDELSYLIVTHWGYDEKSKRGELIVHNDIADEVIEIFKELYKMKFSIQKIRLIDEYEGNDDESMKDNNSSAFNCRYSKGSSTKFSKHSYGLAIDINPLDNPYIKNGTVSPPQGRKSRKKLAKGMIRKGDACYNAFIKRGWIWGGEWKTLKDYQHFEKK